MAQHHESAPTTTNVETNNNNHDHVTLQDLLVVEEKKEKREEERHHHQDISTHSGETHEEKKGFMEKMKDKLHSGAHKNTDEGSAPVDYHPAETGIHRDEPEEKKGFMEKIKDKLPGHHKDGAAETQEKETSGVTH